jgi:hypothetical protein
MRRRDGGGSSLSVRLDGGSGLDCRRCRTAWFIRHIYSASAKSTFRAPCRGRRRVGSRDRLSSERRVHRAQSTRSANRARSTRITTSSCTFYKLKSSFRQQGLKFSRSAYDRMFSFEARILHQPASFIRETVLSRSSVPPGHVAAGFGQACGGESRHREPAPRSLSWNRLYRRASSQSSFC